MHATFLHTAIALRHLQKLFGHGFDRVYHLYNVDKHEHESAKHLGVPLVHYADELKCPRSHRCCVWQ